MNCAFQYSVLESFFHWIFHWEGRHCYVYILFSRLSLPSWQRNILSGRPMPSHMLDFGDLFSSSMECMWAHQNSHLFVLGTAGFDQFIMCVLEQSGYKRWQVDDFLYVKGFLPAPALPDHLSIWRAECWIWSTKSPEYRRVACLEFHGCQTPVPTAWSRSFVIYSNCFSAFGV